MVNMERHLEVTSIGLRDIKLKPKLVRPLSWAFLIATFITQKSLFPWTASENMIDRPRFLHRVGRASYSSSSTR